jgi:hypothetical protein
MKSLYIVCIAIELLTSCTVAQSGGEVPTVNTQTQTALPINTTSFTLITALPSDTPTPVSTPTPFNVSKINLESILPQPSNLPTGITNAEIRNTLPDLYNGIDPTAKKIYQEFEKDNKYIGGIAILLYNSGSDAAANFTIILWHMGGNGHNVDVENLGEEARSSVPGEPLILGGGGGNGTDLLFQRCIAVVHIRILGEVDRDNLIYYAKELDDELIPIVCL